MTTRTARSLLLLALLATAAACGGAGGPSAPGGPTGPGGGITPNVTMKGVITARAAGEITVNGVTLATPATVRIEKAERPEAELHRGMVVKVRARVEDRTGQATEVAFEDVAKGKVEAKLDDHTLSVGGQTVRVDDSTEFEDSAARLGAISAGDRVRVSGVPDDKGGLRATRIDRDAGASEDLEVKGVVSGLGAGGFTLRTSPDAGPADTYSVLLAAGVVLPAGLADGAFVEVRSLGPVQAGNVIEAVSVTLEDRLGEARAEVEVEGIVTSGGAAAFVVAGTSVTTTGATLWRGGTSADLIPGVKVEAEGTLQADGTLLARQVSFRASARLQGAAGAITLGEGGRGALVVNGVAVRIDWLTDQRDALAGLSEGDLVEVRGFPARDGAGLVATRLERRNDDRPVLQGVVTAADAVAGTLTILGKAVDLGSVEAGGLRDYGPSPGADGPALARDAFLAAITPGVTVVKARGRDLAAFADPVLTAKEAELEGERTR